MALRELGRLKRSRVAVVVRSDTTGAGPIGQAAFGRGILPQPPLLMAGGGAGGVPQGPRTGSSRGSAAAGWRVSGGC